MGCATDFIKILVTLKDKSLAEQVAKNLIIKKLAACVQLKPIHSFYEWDHKICSSDEIELSIKTHINHFQSITDYINQESTYDITQIIAVPIMAGDRDYMQWLNESISTQQ